MKAIYLVLTIIVLSVALPAYGVAQEDVVTGNSQDAQQQDSANDTGNSSAPSEQVERPEVKPPKSIESFYQQDAEHYFNPDEVKKLLAGDSEFYVLFQDDMTGRPKGVALLLPDWSHGAGGSHSIEFLRTQLPDYGWVTLSMAVPESHSPVFTTGQSEANPQPADPSVRIEPSRFIDEQYMQQYELQFKMRMQALISEAQNYQGYFIVIAQGSSAAVLASLYAKGEITDQPEAMILLSAAMPDFKLTKKMNVDIASNPIATLDIYLTHGRRWVYKHVAERKRLARKHFKVSYRQKELFSDISYHNQNHRLLRTIYGWLNTQGL